MEYSTVAPKSDPSTRRARATLRRKLARLRREAEAAILVADFDYQVWRRDFGDPLLLAYIEGNGARLLGACMGDEGDRVCREADLTFARAWARADPKDESRVRKIAHIEQQIATTAVEWR